MDPDLERIIDAIAWAKTQLLITSAARANQGQLKKGLANLKIANADVKKVVTEYGKTLPDNLRVEIRVCELGFDKLSEFVICSEN